MAATVDKLRAFFEKHLGIVKKNFNAAPTSDGTYLPLCQQAEIKYMHATESETAIVSGSVAVYVENSKFHVQTCSQLGRPMWYNYPRDVIRAKTV